MYSFYVGTLEKEVTWYLDKYDITSQDFADWLRWQWPVYISGLDLAVCGQSVFLQNILHYIKTSHIVFHATKLMLIWR
jgi:hypothetical protein